MGTQISVPSQLVFSTVPRVDTGGEVGVLGSLVVDNK